MRIAAFEGFYSGSHKQWLDQLSTHSSHDFRLFTLPARAWKWRMHGGAITLADKYNKSDFNAECFLLTDMIDASVLRIRANGAGDLPVVLYMHENQLNYPWSDIDRDLKRGRNYHYAFINYTSALAADQVWFNSVYHREAFLSELPSFLKMYPDFKNLSTVSEIERKSCVLPLGLDLSGIQGTPSRRRPPYTILWNHRWEYDKDPESFFGIMFELEEKGLDYRLAVCGAASEQYPEIFDMARQRLAHRIDHWGFTPTRDEYISLLATSDILPVTSNQDFFGISVVEAIAAGVLPILPDRLAYAEHIVETDRAVVLYRSEEDLKKRLVSMLESRDLPELDTSIARAYDWRNMIGRYDRAFDRLLA